MAGISKIPCGSIKPTISFNGSLVKKVEPIKAPTLKPLKIRFIKVDKPKGYSSSNIKK
jgi:hypothetical protein